ncbi:hypothetical protein COV18_06320 [Candidatus Woesearchaeota archaeon CG10_big_fil_rev_8_21_14_0_10_37_12]|nr:MAG: hypothetical protein COV18_06320 [Candidatus Woesearchaeota archaeon CG10_big_fil_rev_8_21_14_0_10_37_12]
MAKKKIKQHNIFSDLTKTLKEIVAEPEEERNELTVSSLQSEVESDKFELADKKLENTETAEKQEAKYETEEEQEIISEEQETEDGFEHHSIIQNLHEAASKWKETGTLHVEAEPTTTEKAKSFYEKITCLFPFKKKKEEQTTEKIQEEQLDETPPTEQAQHFNELTEDSEELRVKNNKSKLESEASEADSTELEEIENIYKQL